MTLFFSFSIFFAKFNIQQCIAGSSNGRTAALCAIGAFASGEGAESQTMFMYEVYVLKSEKDGIRYIGNGKNALERLRRHNKGDYRFTKGHRPWKLIYKELFNTRSEAMKREKFLKSGKGREWLDRNKIK